MKKLIVALLLFIIPFEGHASSRADRYRPKVDYKLATEIVNNIANSIADSVDAINKDFDWLRYNTSELIYIHCVAQKYNGKFYNKNFCEKISEQMIITTFMEGKVESILREDKHPYPHDDLLRQYVHNEINHFFNEEKDNIVITESYYVKTEAYDVEPEYTTIMENIYQLASELLGLFR